MAGVGGQGTILASKLLTLGLLSAGYDVKMSEIHGMSQRGGSVTSQIRYGDNVHSPFIELGSADIVCAFEKLEALRCLEYLKPEGTVIVNDHRIDPMSVITQAAVYPENILETLREKARVIVVPAADIAREINAYRSMNIVLLGCVVKLLKLNAIDWEAIIDANVKKEFAEVNKKAFRLGYERV
jgi:indolepyruvate ferredoxin oxidoreductase beta subunit